MDNNLSIETLKEIKQEQDDEDLVIDNWKFSIERELDYADSKITTDNTDFENFFHNCDLRIQDFPEVTDFEREIDDMEHVKQFQDTSWKQECDINNVKEEIDIEYSIDNENICYECYECDLQFELHCSYQVHLDNYHKLSESPSNKSKNQSFTKSNLDILCLPDDIQQRGEQGNIKLGLNTENKHGGGDSQSNEQSSDFCNTNKISCEVCQKTFINKRTLAVHTIAIHNDVKFHCRFCQKQFNYRTGLISHENAFHRKIRYECQVCQKMFRYKFVLVNHVRVVHDKVRYECDICHVIYRSRDTLHAHINAVHKKITYECRVCHKSFAYRRNLGYHVKAVHDGTKYECEVCHRTFTLKHNLRVHMKTKHCEKKTNDKCLPDNSPSSRQSSDVCDANKFDHEICQKKFNSKHDIVKQVKTGHNEVKFHCEICQKAFNNKQNLARHTTLVHKGVKYECEICHETYSFKRSLDKHINKIHKKIKHECRICHKSFSYKRNLRRHAEAVHGEAKHKCQVCHKMFTNKNSLREHMETNQGGSKPSNKI